MSQFSGQQYRGVKRVLKELKREEAEVRQKVYDKKKHAALEQEVIELLELEEKLGLTATIEDAGENTGPATPGLVKRNRKVRGVVRNQRKTEAE